MLVVTVLHHALSLQAILLGPFRGQHQARHPRSGFDIYVSYLPPLFLSIPDVGKADHTPRFALSALSSRVRSCSTLWISSTTSCFCSGGSSSSFCSGGSLPE